MRKAIKNGVTALAFVPALILVISLLKVIPRSGFVINMAVIFNFPATLVAALLNAYDVDKDLGLGLFLLALYIWSTLIAIIFRRMAGMFLGEEEPLGQKFDWIGYQVRFFCGFVIGFLSGWRFVRYSTDTKTILIAMFATGIFGGLVLGAWRENFWSRPL